MAKKPRTQDDVDGDVDLEKQHRERVAAIARETMTGDLRDCILDFLKHNNNPLPWNVQSEGAQRDTVEKVTNAVQTAVEKCVLLIASDARPTIVATLKKVTVSDEIKAEVIMGKSDPQRHNLIDAQGMTVLIIVTDSAPYEGEKAPVDIKKDQGNLIDDGDDDGSVFDKTPAGRH